VAVNGLSGAGILRASWTGTAAFGVTAVAGAAAQGVLSWLAFAVAVTLFVIGCVVFVWAYAVAVRRSRTDEIAVAGLYLLSGSTPKPVRRQLLSSLAVEVVVAFATAAARPYTIAATGILVPVYGLGMAGLWAARHGTFAPRQPTPRRR
jgi:hypothetical protein